MAQRLELEVRLRARRIGSDHPDRVEPASGDGRGLQSQDRLCVCEQQCHPAGTVVGPLRIHDLIMIDAEKGDDLRQILGLDISASDQWRCRESEPRSVAADAYESCSALLDQFFGILCYPACLRPGMCRAERRVAGERQLDAGSEDPYLIVGPLISGRGQECRLAQIGPLGEVGHLLRGQLVGVVHNSHRVSEHQLVGEDINLCEPEHDESLTRTCDTVGMQKISLEALARQQMKLAATAAGRHTADTVYGGHEKVLRQTVIGMIAGARLGEHENPGEATSPDLAWARTTRGSGPVVGGGSGDLLIMPDNRHSLEALEDSAVLLTVAKL